MGVDYSGNYGIGVRLIEPSEMQLSSIGCDDFEEYRDWIEELPRPNILNLDFFDVGDYYDGETTWYICIHNALNDGLRIFEERVRVFTELLEDNEIEYEGEVNQVGGLCIY